MDEMKELRAQITSLREGLKASKEDLEMARKTRDTLISARKAAQDEASKLEIQVGRAESQAAASQDSLNRTRKELEESRKKELRLRDKLKELMELQHDNHTDIDKTHVENIERELEILRTQNLTLRKAAEDKIIIKSKNNAYDDERIDDKKNIKEFNNTNNNTNNVSSKFATSKGNVLGVDIDGLTTGGGIGGDNDIRNLQHNKWESEKKLQKRISILEKRLEEKISDIEELQNQLKRSKEMTMTAIASKEEMNKKAAATLKQTQVIIQLLFLIFFI